LTNFSGLFPPNLNRLPLIMYGLSLEINACSFLFPSTVSSSYPIGWHLNAGTQIKHTIAFICHWHLAHRMLDRDLSRTFLYFFRVLLLSVTATSIIFYMLIPPYLFQCYVLLQWHSCSTEEQILVVQWLWKEMSLASLGRHT